MRAALLSIALFGPLGCAQVDPPTPEAVLPTDYRTAFVQVRGCRSSLDHDLANVIVRVRGEQAPRYEAGPYPMPEGALVVKEQYRDSQCQDFAGYTAMRKEKGGYFPAGGDWQWFTLDPVGTIVQKGKVNRCAGCHSMCGGKRDLLCTEP